MQQGDGQGLVPLLARAAFEGSSESKPQGTRGGAGQQSTWGQRVGSAVLYCAASLLITLSNKIVLTSFDFPSAELLGLCQLAATVAVLTLGRLLKVVRVPPLSGAVLRVAWPLPCLFLANLLFGLAGTKSLSLPIFIALRRFTIVMTLLAEVVLLRTVPPASVQLSVLVMTAGSLLAALSDLNATLAGAAFVMANNACSAVQGACVKRCLPHLGSIGVLFFNATVSLPAVLLLVLANSSADKTGAASLHSVLMEFDGWSDWRFIGAFTISCMMGVALQMGALLCVDHNSALTASIMGSVKNVCVTYVGMFVGGDYLFTPANFVGINVSVLGTLTYLWLTFRK
ncbi:Hypothetical predicted protein [Cloeon dipterum]|uniref:Sugar phosphate transporter domain-containing protein n=1 Tax=Cloeon dipterum TaxID=197152 RepID=A0A8S1DDQ8_9INSE|nr:Hypothetical predicted protein [Cloeon dipterum]